MSPDSPDPSRQRKAWRILACLGCVLSAFSLLATVALYSKVQDSRVEAVRLQCEATNERHRGTIRQLDALIAKLPPKRQARARASKPGTVLLINSLVPYRSDCRRYARSLVTPQSGK